MPSERILAVGFVAEGELIDATPFDGEAALSSCRHAAVDPVAVPLLWRGLAGPEAVEAANRLAELLQRRRREATELVAGGGTLLCVLRPVGPTLRVAGDKPIVLHAYAWLPEEPSLARLVIAPASGGVQATDEAHPAWPLIRAQGARMRPAACAANAQLPPHWHVVAADGEGRPVAFEVRVGEGRVVFIPPIGADSPIELGALLESFFARRAGPAAHAPAPDWLEAILLPGQEELARRLAQLAGQIEGLEREFIGLRKRHARLVLLNKLLAARDGRELAGPASAAFQLLGFRVEASDAASLELHSDEGAALVVLVASEQAADSDAYWDLVHRTDARQERPAKGVILANAFSPLPPGERGTAFPDLLCRGALHRSVCLLAATELHRAAEAVLANPDAVELRGRLRRAILDATGPCDLSQALPAKGDQP
ncbi:MAG: hypothetical protein FJ291_23015 [Planctomycetes bacterium]|nr:hypothetical protein [Planctomycetota bacterium]